MKISPRSSRKRSKLKVWEIIVGGGIATTIVFPIYWMIITGLRPQTETFSSTPKLIPTNQQVTPTERHCIARS